MLDSENTCIDYQQYEQGGRHGKEDWQQSNVSSAGLHKIILFRYPHLNLKFSMKVRKYLLYEFRTYRAKSYYIYNKLYLTKILFFKKFEPPKQLTL